MNLTEAIAVLILATGFSWILNRILLKFAKTLGIHSNDDGTIIRWGSRSKPTVGGITFFLTFLVSSIAYFLLHPNHKELLSTEYYAFFICVTLGFLIGLADDAYDTNPWLKLLGQSACAITMIIGGVFIKLFNIPWIDIPLTYIWVIAIMNSINLLDNMDGIAASLSLSILSISLLMMKMLTVEADPLQFAMVSACGAFLGFLYWNWKPSKIYMGDTGSQFLGAILAFVGIKFFWNVQNLEGESVFTMNLLIPSMTFIVLLMDTSFVFFARIMRGQSPMVGGKDHITHHLTYVGIPEPLIPVLLGGITLLSGMLGIFAVRYIKDWNHVYTAMFTGYLVFTIAIFTVLYIRGGRIAKLSELRKKRDSRHASIEVLEKAIQPRQPHLN